MASTVERYNAEVIYEPFHDGFDERNPNDYAKLTLAGGGKWIRFSDYQRETKKLEEQLQLCLNALQLSLPRSLQPDAWTYYSSVIKSTEDVLAERVNNG